MAIAIEAVIGSKAYKTLVSAPGHEIVVDEPLDHGGEDTGPSPQQLLVASLASCTLITLKMYMNRKGWDLGKVSASVVLDTDDLSSRKVSFQRTIRFERVPDEQQAERLLLIANKCPVHQILSAQTAIITSIERTT